MTFSIMHSCDESDDSLRITSVEVEVEVNFWDFVGNDSSIESIVTIAIEWD